MVLLLTDNLGFITLGYFITLVFTAATYLNS